MSSRLRRANSSKVSFFAFQDIITSVSGILILVVLILATELDKPVANGSGDAVPETHAHLSRALSELADLNARIGSLQEIVTAAQSVPAGEKLEADIALVRSELAKQENKHSELAQQLTEAARAIEDRDRALGLTGTKAQIRQLEAESDALTQLEFPVQRDMEDLERKVAFAQARLLRLKSREGQLWLIPDKSFTTKEPILFTVAASGAVVDHFDRADQRKQIGTEDASFRAYLSSLNSVNQYVVFLIRPSGISLFKTWVKIAREKGFEVGFDALGEEQEVHFSAPPSIDDTQPTTTSSTNSRPRQTPTSTGPGLQPTNGPAAVTHQANTAASGAVAASDFIPHKKSWWQRLKEWLGLA